MTVFFSTFMQQRIFANQNLLHNANIKIVLFREAPDFGGNDARYTGIKTAAELLQQPGWVEAAATGYPLGNQVPLSRRKEPPGPTPPTKNNYMLFNEFPFTGMGQAEVKACAFYYVGSEGGTTNPLIMVTNTPFVGGRMVLKDGDSVTANPDASMAGSNRWLLGWADPGSATSVALIEGPLSLFRSAPTFEASHTQHIWLYPQRANMIANPSFDSQDTAFWSSNRTPLAVSVGSEWHGQFSGGTPVIVESNVFPTSREERWTIQCKAKGNGNLKIGFVWWDDDFEEVSVDWGTETFKLNPNGFVPIAVVRTPVQTYQGMVRFECDGDTLVLDEILCEHGFLKEWPYFDGETKYGAREDYCWYGGQGRQGASYSLWYNNKRATYGRLFARNIDDDEIVTDKDMEGQGKVYQWVPAGTTVVPHIDVLYPNDLQSPVPAKQTGVLPYRVDPYADVDGVTNPWV